MSNLEHNYLFCAESSLHMYVLLKPPKPPEHPTAKPVISIAKPRVKKIFKTVIVREYLPYFLAWGWSLLFLAFKLWNDQWYHVTTVVFRGKRPLPSEHSCMLRRKCELPKLRKIRQRKKSTCTASPSPSHTNPPQPSQGSLYRWAYHCRENSYAGIPKARDSRLKIAHMMVVTMARKKKSCGALYGGCGATATMGNWYPGPPTGGAYLI